MNKKTLISIVILVLILVVISFVIRPTRVSVQISQNSSQPVNTITFACDESKTISASFYDGPSLPSSNNSVPPTPGGSVALTLSDGRTMTLSQTISADGARYASTDGTIVFWNKGNGVMFTENNVQTFTGCIAVAQNTGDLSQVYENSTEGFSLRYPAGFTPDATYTYQALGPGKDIAGVKFTIPASTAKGTNLAPDSYISVEELPQVQSCTADSFASSNAHVSTIMDGDATYSFASSTDAGAGNRYEEMVYALPGTNPCIAVRYFIHYSVLENYPAGTVSQFDEQTLISQFDSIRHTLVVE